MRRYAPFLILVLILLVGYCYKSSIDRAVDRERGNKPADQAGGSQDAAPPVDAPRPARHKPPRLDPFPDTITLLPAAASAEALNSPETSPEDDLSLIHSLLRSHRSALGTNPVGLNDEITSALTGKNRKGAASLAANHPAISENGELLDRWGTPYRFHAYSGKLLEITSAGPDKKFFTPDDLSLRE